MIETQLLSSSGFQSYIVSFDKIEHNSSFSLDLYCRADNYEFQTDENSSTRNLFVWEVDSICDNLVKSIDYYSNTIDVFDKNVEVINTVFWSIQKLSIVHHSLTLIETRDKYLYEGIRLSFHNTDSFSFQRPTTKSANKDDSQIESINKLYSSMWTWSCSAADSFVCEFVRPAGMTASFSLKY